MPRLVEAKGPADVGWQMGLATTVRRNEKTRMKEDYLLHQAPVWRDKADFIINARIEDLDDGGVQWWEQLWTRELPGNRYEVCCIPFGVSDL
jgi:hypothetical protein